jgi:shikimate dehydrogenase
MDRLAVIGDPVGHSLSPRIHMIWIDKQKRDASYESIRVPAGQTAAALNDFSQQEYRGLNVTLPHKQAVLDAVSEASPGVQAIGAANTLSRQRDGSWRADNTDAPGLMRALDRAGAGVVEKRRIIVLGAGGAARAALFALDRADAEILLLNRTVEKAGQVIADCCQHPHGYGPLEELETLAEDADLIINTTSAGHSGDFIQLPSGDGRLFYDMSYGKPSKPQLGHAGDMGWRTEDGLGMLVCQAAESFRIWFGGDLPDIEIALAACRQALEGDT